MTGRDSSCPALFRPPSARSLPAGGRECSPPKGPRLNRAPLAVDRSDHTAGRAQKRERGYVLVALVGARLL